MAESANTQQEARQAWVTPYAFEPSQGGLGVLINVTGTSQRIALPGKGNMLVVDIGSFPVHLAFGDSAVVATTDYLRLRAACTLVVAVPTDVNGVAPTHLAVISGGTNTDIQITRGFGI